MKNFFNDHKNNSVLKEWAKEDIINLLGKWNEEVPKHVNIFNESNHDRHAVLYFALFTEFHINRLVEILFPDFKNIAGENTSNKIKLLSSFRLIPDQIFMACKCINQIRNEFAHKFSLTNLSDLDGEGKNTLIKLTNEYQGDYVYEEAEDTIKNRFKSLCMNTITALRLYESQVQKLRIYIDNFEK